MPISSVGRTTRERGVTLIEMMVVVTLMALLAGLSYPSAAAGVDSLRLRSASDSIIGFLHTALDRADRRQQAVAIWISMKEGTIVAKSADGAFDRRLEMRDPIHISAILPAVQDPDETRRFVVYPGGSVPPIRIEISNQSGRKRMVSIDPITGVPRSELTK